MVAGASQRCRQNPFKLSIYVSGYTSGIYLNIEIHYSPAYILGSPIYFSIGSPTCIQERSRSKVKQDLCKTVAVRHDDQKQYAAYGEKA